MSEHTLRAYDRKLVSLTETIVAMGRQVEHMMQLAGKAMRDHQPAMVDEARAADKQVNEYERQIEQQVNELLALQNPMAIDLRYITSSSKIAASLERMGDLAKSIVRQNTQTASTPSAEMLQQLELMLSVAQGMLQDAIAAFTHLNAPKATEVWTRDDRVDQACDAVFLQVIDTMRADPAALEHHMQWVFVSKNIERMADYATKVAKIVHYVTSGKTPSKATLQAEASAMLASQLQDA